MKNTVTERQQYDRARRRSQGPAKMLSPLRHVLAKHSYMGLDAKGAPVRHYDGTAKRAIRAAAEGDGRLVQELAMAG